MDKPSTVFDPKNMTPEQEAEVRSKVEECRKKIEQEGIEPYLAMGLTESFLEGVYKEAYRLYYAGQYARSSNLMKVLMVLHPKEPKFSLGAAACAQQLKDYDTAIKNYLVVADLVPVTPLPFFYIYECCMQLNRPELAKEALEILLRRAKANPIYQSMADKAQFMLDGLNLSNPELNPADKQE